jgi:hypothetical protein
MTTYFCQDCDTEFTAERSTARLKCGSLAVELIAAPGASREAGREEQAVPEVLQTVREILLRLCRGTYCSHTF